MNLEEAKAILDKKCLICGISNRFHKVFWAPGDNYYVKQQIEESYLNEPLITGHFACLDNLTYLEYINDTKDAEER